MGPGDISQNEKNETKQIIGEATGLEQKEKVVSVLDASWRDLWGGVSRWRCLAGSGKHRHGTRKSVQVRTEKVLGSHQSIRSH